MLWASECEQLHALRGCSCWRMPTSALGLCLDPQNFSADFRSLRCWEADLEIGCFMVLYKLSVLYVALWGNYRAWQSPTFP